jgi:hypothetical protein
MSEGYGIFSPLLKFLIFLQNIINERAKSSPFRRDFLAIPVKDKNLHFVVGASQGGITFPEQIIYAPPWLVPQGGTI